jgi:hypothetical protein
LETIGIREKLIDLRLCLCPLGFGFFDLFNVFVVGEDKVG